MAFAPQPFVEQPNLRVPLALIVDDGVPCINPVWYFRHQVDGQKHPAHTRDIPVSFMEEWCRWVVTSKVRGDFTILPFPAGLGRIDQALTGYDPGELRAWRHLAQEAISPQFDIHAEILTHTNALDLKTKQLIPISEHEWTEAQDEKTLSDYFAEALQILGEAGLPAHGLTQPCFYRGDESLYARALLDAEKRVNQRQVTHNFLHMDSVSSRVPPRVTYLDASAGEAVVSHWTGTDDYLWNAQDFTHADHTLPPEGLADRFLTADGQAGRLTELFAGGGPLVMVTHWQSLYSNGSGLGLKTFREVASRVASVFGDKVAWRKLSEITAQHLAATTVRLEATADANSVSVALTSPFSADILTVSIPTPWPLYKAPEVLLDGTTLIRVADAAQLQAGQWLMRGSLVTVSVSVTAGQSRSLVIKSLP
jgi:hypothetical protein